MESTDPGGLIFFRSGALDKNDDIAKSFLLFWLENLPEDDAEDEEYKSQLQDTEQLSEVSCLPSVNARASASIVQVKQTKQAASLQSSLSTGISGMTSVARFFEQLRCSKHAGDNDGSMGKAMICFSYGMTSALVAEVEKEGSTKE